MDKKNKIKPTDHQPPPPGADDFSNRAIKRKVFSEALQHPATLYSAAIAVLSGAYMGLIDFSETAFAIAMGSALVSLASWVYHYFIRGDETAKRYVHKLLKRREQFKLKQGEDIGKRCKESGFLDGEQAALELKQAYTRLKDFLELKLKERQTLTAQRFLLLAEESYYRGIQFLKKAHSLYEAIGQMDGIKLDQELQTWKKELRAVEQDTEKGAEYKDLLISTLKQKIRSHTKRIALYKQRKETLDQVLAECEVLEATLDTTYLEVVDLMQDGTGISPREDVASNLERAVAAARRVEDRLRGMNNENSDDDQYLEAAKSAGPTSDS